MNMAHGSEISPWQAWLIAIRPKTLPAAVSPVLVGTALAVSDGVFTPLPAVAALVGALLIQIGANLANDYFDYVKGADIPERKGPKRVAQSGLIALPRLRLGIAVTFALTALVGAYLIFVGGWPILLIGLASLLSSLAYTGGPFPIGYHGLGDLFVFLFFGVAAVCGTYYVQALSISPDGCCSFNPGGFADGCHPGDQQPARHRDRPANGKADACGHDRARGHSTGVRASACIGLCRIVAALARWMVVSMDLVALAIAAPRRASRAHRLSERRRSFPEQDPGRDRESGPCILYPVCHRTFAMNRVTIGLRNANRTPAPWFPGP